MSYRTRTGRKLVLVATAIAASGAVTAIRAKDDDRFTPQRLARDIEHVLVIDLENEDFGVTFGPASPAVYLNQHLLRQGQLVVNYFATSHVSLGNYLSQVSGQGPTPDVNNDCLDLSSLSNPPVLDSVRSSRCSISRRLRRRTMSTPAVDRSERSC